MSEIVSRLLKGFAEQGLVSLAREQVGILDPAGLRRIAGLMQLIEEVAFRKLDQRLAALLLGKGPSVHTTHQQLADELGTVREIVTRLLRRFERDGLARCGREQIELLDAAALRTLASGAADAR